MMSAILHDVDYSSKREKQNNHFYIASYYEYAYFKMLSKINGNRYLSQPSVEYWTILVYQSRF